MKEMGGGMRVQKAVSLNRIGICRYVKTHK